MWRARTLGDAAAALHRGGKEWMIAASRNAAGVATDALDSSRGPPGSAPSSWPCEISLKGTTMKRGKRAMDRAQGTDAHIRTAPERRRPFWEMIQVPVPKIPLL